MSVHTSFEIHLDLSQLTGNLKKLPDRLRRTGWREAQKVSREMVTMSQSLLPEGWLLRRSLAPRAFWVRRGMDHRLYATISFREGFRPITSKGYDTRKKRLRKGDPLMSWRNPRKYGWFHDQGHPESRTPSRLYIESPKQRFLPIFESAVKTSWDQILGG